MRGRVHAGKTTYTTDSHPNSTKPRQVNNMNVNGYKNAEDTQKQTNMYLGKDGSTALELSVTNVTGGLKLVYERSTSPSSHLSTQKPTGQYSN